MSDTQLSFFPVETEAQVKSRKLSELAARDAERLEKLRKAARYLVYSNHGLAVHRVPYSVCADDVMEYLELRKVPRSQSRFLPSHNVNGQIFRGGEWVKIGRVKSRREGRQNNEIALWTLKDYEVKACDYWDEGLKEIIKIPTERERIGECPVFEIAPPLQGKVE